MSEINFKYAPQALDYVRNNRDTINSVALTLGISPLAVAAGIVREQTLIVSRYPNEFVSVVANYIKDPVPSFLSVQNNQTIRSEYNLTAELPLATLMNPSIEQARYPLLMDFPPANIKLFPAISMETSENC